MVIRWKNGLFRLWLVLSIFWSLSFIGFFYFSDKEDKNNGFFQTYVSLTLPLKDGTIIELDGSLPLNILKQEIVRKIGVYSDNLLKSGATSEAELQRATAEETADAFIEIVKNANERKKQRLFVGLMATFAPPIVVFALGLLLMWIIAGFRAN